MIQQRLLQRLANSQTIVKQPQQVALSIANNIVNILSTRRDSTLIRDDMGLQDMRNLTIVGKAELAEMANYILYQINAFEPRLQKVVVECQSQSVANVLFLIIIRGQTNDANALPVTIGLFCFNNGKIVLKDIAI
jgi:type VI secretion system lysozyme-like protein